MRKVLFSVVAFLALIAGAGIGASAQTQQKIQGFCENGGQAVVTDGRSSTTKVQRSYQSCVVTVYDTGTTNLAVIYSDYSLTPKANPFTADVDGYWFWIANPGRYDVKLSGSGITSPITRSGYWIADGSGGGGSLPQATLRSSNYSALTSDWLVSMDATAGVRTITLYSASGNSGRIIQTCKRDTSVNQVNVTDGTTTWNIFTSGTCIQFISDGSAWQIQSY